MRIIQTRTFINSAKRLHAHQKKILDDAVRSVVSDPKLGESKTGDLAGIRVYKFKMVGQLILLAYEWRDAKDVIILLAMGSHENFYRDIKHVLN